MTRLAYLEATFKAVLYFLSRDILCYLFNAAIKKTYTFVTLHLSNTGRAILNACQDEAQK